MNKKAIVACMCLIAAQAFASEKHHERGPVPQFVYKLAGAVDLTHESQLCQGGHFNKILKRFFDVARDEKSARRILKCLADHIDFLSNGRRMIIHSQALREFSGEEINFMNRLQTWLPWVNPDMDDELLKYGAEKLQECSAKLEYPDYYEKEKGYFTVPGLYDYITMLVANDLLPGDTIDREFLTNDVDRLRSGVEYPKSRHLLYQGPIEIPDAFLTSEKDYNNLLEFIYQGLQATWEQDCVDLEGTMPRDLCSMILYRFVLNADQEKYEFDASFQEMSKYLSDDLSRVSFLSEHSQLSENNRTVHTFLSYRCEYLIKNFKDFYDIHPIPSENVKKNRALWIRLVDWFSMLHRLNLMRLKNEEHENSEIPIFSSTEIWHAVRALLSQRLLAEDKIIRPVAEMLARCTEDIPLKIYKELLYSPGPEKIIEGNDCLGSDLEALALHCVEAMPDEYSHYAGLKNTFNLQRSQVQALFIEAAIEEVLLACDAFAEIYENDEDVNSMDRMLHTFGYYLLKDVSQESWEVKRLAYALQMLSNALNGEGLDNRVKLEAPEALKGEGRTSKDWREKYRAMFLGQIKQQVAEFLKVNYAEIEKRADQALAKILPHILTNFDVKKEFPAYAEETSQRVLQAHAGGLEEPSKTALGSAQKVQKHSKNPVNVRHTVGQFAHTLFGNEEEPGHVPKMWKSFFAALRNKESAQRVLKFLAQNLDFLRGGRQVVDASTPGAEDLLPEEIRLINRWQAWTPWIRLDLYEGCFTYACAQMQRCVETLEGLESVKTARVIWDMKGMGEYMTALVCQDLLPYNPEASHVEDALEDTLDGLIRGANFGKRAQPLLYESAMKIPGAFLASQDDHQNLLYFIYKPLIGPWVACRDRHEQQIPSALFDMLVYRSVLNAGEEGYDCNMIVLTELKKYLKVNGSPVTFRDKKQSHSGKSEAMIKAASAVNAEMSHVCNLYEVRAIPKENLQESRALWIRLVDWFSMLHRLSMMAQTRSDPSAAEERHWSSEEVWRVMQALLSQRLLAGDEILKPVAEILDVCKADIPLKIYQDLLYFDGAYGQGSEHEVCIESDLEALALHKIHVTPYKPAHYTGLKKAFDLKPSQVQALFVEAAVEEVVLACDAVSDIYDRRRSGFSQGVIQDAFKQYAVKKIPDDAEVKGRQRLLFALQMLSNALNRLGLDAFVKIDCPEVLQETAKSATEWRDEKREIFVDQLKQKVSAYMKVDYSEIQKWTNQALAKILPHIVTNFDATKVFSGRSGGSRQKGASSSIKAKVLKVKVRS